MNNNDIISVIIAIESVMIVKIIIMTNLVITIKNNYNYNKSNNINNNHRYLYIYIYI